MDGWNRLAGALGNVLPQLRLRPGVTPVVLDSAEAELGFELPADYRAWLQIADGQEPDGLALFPFPVGFSPLARVITKWKSAKQLDASSPQTLHSCDLCRGAVRSFAQRSDRLPIGIVDDDDAIALDLLPDRLGQVRVMFDDRHYCLMGQSLSAYFDKLAGHLYRGELAPGPGVHPDGAGMLYGKCWWPIANFSNS